MKSERSRPERQTQAQLESLQRLMADAIMRPLGPDGGMRPRLPDGSSARKLAAAFIEPNDRLAAFERLEIYSRQYWFRLLDCFGEDFPGLREILGERRFDRLAVAYLTQHPSTSFTLRNLGRHLVAFLQAEPRWAGACLQAALDMARLEWAHIEAFDNTGRTPLTADDLLGRDADHLRLGLQPYLSLLELAYPLDRLLIAIKHADTRSEEASNAVTAPTVRRGWRPRSRLRRETVFLAVHRLNHSVFYKRLELAQFLLLRALQGGATLGEALSRLTGSPSAPTLDPQDIQHWFRDWSSLGWFHLERD